MKKIEETIARVQKMEQYFDGILEVSEVNESTVAVLDHCKRENRL